MDNIDKEKFMSELRKISMSNEDLGKFGDGFEKAIELVYGVINKLTIHDVSKSACENIHCVDGIVGEIHGEKIYCDCKQD